MKRISRRLRLMLTGVILMFIFAFGGSAVQAATTTLDYAKVSYAKNLSLPIAGHVWRVSFTNLNKASDAIVTSSDTSVAGAVVYRNTMKQSCIYVTPHKAGQTVIKVSFSYKSSGKTITKSYSMNLTVYAWAKPLKAATLGKKNYASHFKSTNFSSSAKIPAGKAIVRMTPNNGWTVEGIYAQGLKKNGTGVVYTTVQIPNNKVYNFSVFKIKPDIYVKVHNASKNMTLILMLAGG